MRRVSAQLTAPLALAAAALACVPLTGTSEAPREAHLGRVTMPNSGAPEAQEAFLAGLAALHSFFYDEAADLFRKAQEQDRGFALAYWGEALTYDHPLWGEQDAAAARAALDRLAPTPEERAAKAGTAREKAYLASAEVLWGEGSRRQRHQAYSEALRALHESDPQDLEAASLYALSLQALQERAAMDMRRQMESAAILEEVFAENPLHPGAAHYLIHAYDDPVHAPLGLRPAWVYAEIAPAAHHALHMPSHIFLQLGMWPEAAASNEAAYAASVGWVDHRGHGKDKQDFHSLSWLQYIYLQQGRVEDALATLATARRAAAAAPSVDSTVREMQARQVVETVPLPLLAGEAAGAAAACDALDGYEGTAATPLFALGWCALARGDQGAAGEISTRLSESAGGGGDRWGRGDQILARELAGLVALASGKQEGGLALLAEAVALEEEAGPPSGPPHPAKPAHELYGEALLALGRAAEAGEHFGASLARTPNRTASLRGAARAAAAAGGDAEPAQTPAGGKGGG